MKLLSLHIENYGLLSDFSLVETELASSPCFIYGLNETGKTTLLSFIRAILFGFKTEGDTVEPVGGGRPGGHLILEAEGVIYRVERFGRGNGKAVVEIAGGAQGGEEMLRTRILRGVSPVLFKNVFAFGVDELRQLETLASSEVNVYIYGAGTGTSPQKLAQASATLDKKAGELFKPRGRVQVLPRLLKELNDLERQIKVLEQQPGHYFKLKQQLATLEQERKQAQELRQTGQRRLDRLDNLIRAREPWHRWQNCLAQLKQSEQITNFPPAGLDRLGVLEARREEQKEQLRTRLEKVRTIEAQLEVLKVDEKILAVATTVQELEEERALYRDRKEALPELLIKVAQGETAIQEKLADLGPGWDEARVLALDTSLASKGQVEDFARRWREQEQKNIFAENRMTNAQRELAHRQDEKEDLEQQLAGLSGAEENQSMAPEKGLKLLEQASQGLGKLEHLGEMQQIKNNMLVEIKQRLNHIRETGATDGSNTSKIALLLALVLLAGLVAGLLFFTGQLDWLVLGMGLVPVVLAYSRWAGEQRTRRTRAEAMQVELERLEKQRGVLEQELAGLAQERVTIKEKLRQAALALTGREILIHKEIPELRQSWQARLEQQRQRDDLTGQLEKAHFHYTRACTELEQAQKEQTSCAQAGTELVEEWQQWLQEKGLPHLPPAGIKEFLALVDWIKAESQRLRLDRAQAMQIEDALKDYQKRVNQLAMTLGQGAVPREQIAVYITGLSKQLKEQQKILEQRQLLVRSLQEAMTAKKLAQENLYQLKQKLGDLVVAGEAKDEEEFRRRGVAYQEYLDLVRRAEELREQLLILAGSEEELKTLKRELESTTGQQHQEEYRALELSLKENQSTIDQLGDDMAARRQEIKVLEKGEELAQVRQKREMVRESLLARARQWRVTVLSKALLELAREKHERERQPAVLDLASRLITTITQGRYVRVVAPVGATAKLEVEEPSGRRVEAACLSRGAASQLYLAVRLALACHFSRLVVPLPVILDDILVDFDARRLKGSLQVLGQVAQELQVILLTCHQHLLAAAQEELPNISLINMENQYPGDKANPKIASPSHEQSPLNRHSII